MINFKGDETLNILNHSCAHVMAQAVKHGHMLHLTELGEQTAQKVYDRHLTLKEMLEKQG